VHCPARRLVFAHLDKFCCSSSRSPEWQLGFSGRKPHDGETRFGHWMRPLSRPKTSPGFYPPLSPRVPFPPLLIVRECLEDNGESPSSGVPSIPLIRLIPARPNLSHAQAMVASHLPFSRLAVLGALTTRPPSSSLPSLHPLSRHTADGD
jgi:hypothetical protein